MAFCLLTHLQELSRQGGLSIDSLRVEQRMRFSKERGDAGSGAKASGRCDGVETHVVAESGEDAERIRDLVDRAWHSCMAMQAIVNATPQETHLHLNGVAVA